MISTEIAHRLHVFGDQPWSPNAAKTRSRLLVSDAMSESIASVACFGIKSGANVETLLSLRFDFSIAHLLTFRFLLGRPGVRDALPRPGSHGTGLMDSESLRHFLDAS